MSFSPPTDGSVSFRRSQVFKSSNLALLYRWTQSNLTKVTRTALPSFAEQAIRHLAMKCDNFLNFLLEMHRLAKSNFELANISRIIGISSSELASLNAILKLIFGTIDAFVN